MKAILDENGNMTKGLRKLKKDHEEREKRFAVAYASYVMTGTLPLKNSVYTSDLHEVWEQLGRIFNPRDKHPARKARMLVRREAVQTMVREEIKRELLDKDVNVGFYIDNLLLILESCKKEEDGNVMVFDRGNALKVMHELGEVLDVKPSTKQITKTEEMNFNEIAENAEGTTKKSAKLKQTTKTPEIEE